MKSGLLLTALFFFFSFAKAQQAFPSFADNAQWSASVCNMALGSTTGNVCFTDSYTYTGQATICGETYSQVNTAYYIRSAGEKVFIRKSANCNEREYLLYDFGMHIGDTIFTGFNLLYGTGTDTVAFKLLSIDTVSMHGQQRRQFTLHTSLIGNSMNLYDQVQWVEGIGSLNHPFHALVCRLSANCDIVSSLLCVFSGGQQIYGGTGANACEVTGRNTDLERLTVKLYPNPTHKKFTLSLPSSNTPFAVRLLDLTGHTVYLTQAITSANQTEYTVSLPSVPAGIYNVRISNETAQTNLKLVIE